MSHLLVTNDFPPKLGGIQSYLWELWRRLPATDATVLTTAHPDARAWDADQQYRVERVDSSVLLPGPGLVRSIDRLAGEVGAGLVLLDPALPVGMVGPRLERRYGIVVHGAEVTVPSRMPVSRSVLRHVLRGASAVVAAGTYPAAEAERAAGRTLPVTLVPPGVDTERFRPLDGAARAKARAALELPVEGRLVVSLSRLVPRKGMDVLIEAAARLAPERPDLTVAIGGSGRDRDRLERLVRRTGAPVRLLGRVEDRDLPMLYGAADVYVMACRNRWAGLEQEGFGIVFLEAAAAGTPQVAGRSGGAAEAVEHEVTVLVIDRPDDPAAVAAAVGRLLDDDDLRSRLGAAGRARAEGSFSYDRLAGRLQQMLGTMA
ncbi:GDP-mannose-dependent alpha-(1-6)-phosphatidylinositol monomannoside mannosyltransferase [soil metagenome]